MEMKCKRCGNEWDYKGQSEWYVTCSNCKTSIRIKELIEGGKS